MVRRRTGSVKDFPYVNLVEAGEIFGVCRGTFYTMLKNGLREEIRYESEWGAGTRAKLLLVDVVRAAYPEADEQTVHIIAANYNNFRTQKRIDARLRKRKEQR